MAEAWAEFIPKYGDPPFQVIPSKLSLNTKQVYRNTRSSSPYLFSFSVRARSPHQLKPMEVEVMVAMEMSLLIMGSFSPWRRMKTKGETLLFATCAQHGKVDLTKVFRPDEIEFWEYR